MTAHTHDDPDREVNPIILQFMAKSTLRAVLSDKNALKSTMEARGITTNASAEDMANSVYDKMKEERLARVKELQRQFIMFLLEGNRGDSGDILTRVMIAWKNCAKEAKEEREWQANRTLRRDSKSTQSAPDFARLMKGLRVGETETCGDSHLIGAQIMVLDTRDLRSKAKSLSIKRESAKGQGFELSDGSYISKDHMGTKWIIKDGAKYGLATEVRVPMGYKLDEGSNCPKNETTALLPTNLPRGSTTLRRKPSVPDLLRTSAKKVGRAASITKRMQARRQTIE